MVSFGAKEPRSRRRRDRWAARPEGQIVLVFFCCALVGATVASEDEWAGVWTGTLVLSGQEHQMQLVLEHGPPLSGRFKIDEDVTGLRLRSVSVDGAGISCECWTAGHQIRLEGTRAGDAIRGKFAITRGEAVRRGTWLVHRLRSQLESTPGDPLDKWSGIWSGATMLGFQRGRLTFFCETARDGTLSGHLRLSEQKKLPLTSVAVDDDRVFIELPVDGAAVLLDGILVEDSIVGRFTMPGGEGNDRSGMWRVGRMGSWKEKSLPAIPDAQPIGELTQYEERVFLSFYARDEKEFQVARTYYVAANVPDASNDNNGLYPNYRGGQDGPFQDFNSRKVRDKLRGSDSGVRMVVRAGTYLIQNLGEDGIVIDGRGDEFHPVILSGYPGERAVLTSDGTVNIPVQVHGMHGIVENLVIASDREVKYDIIVTGDSSIVRHCVFFGPVHEDCVKIGDQADHCFLFNNDISGYGSQCVDNFGVNILFRKNRVHHAGNWKANAFGTKGGTRGVVVACNVFHDLSGGISFGGTGNLELYRKDEEGNLLHATTGAVAVHNTFYNIVGPAVDLQSCLNGVVEGNTIYDSAAGFRVGLAPEQFEGEWQRLAAGLPATRGTVIRDNRLANIAGDAMFLVEDRAQEGLVADRNTYFTDGQPVFLLGRRRLTLGQVRRELGAERHSVVRPAGAFVQPPLGD
jgi:hypothetical protein